MKYRTGDRVCTNDLGHSGSEFDTATYYRINHLIVNLIAVSTDSQHKLYEDWSVRFNIIVAGRIIRDLLFLMAHAWKHNLSKKYWCNFRCLRVTSNNTERYLVE